ncbi:2-keto-3-deoxy-phosphogluconate aldolase [Glaciihabitans tibetensis]|uniref:2-keto-3-deoxy-phosphogluconate aldolase n=1 Tax=Glaciihabitans tibetensis TaxID=1266600 RepID=A0A2T0VE61_9MICO|nr:bifunctional 4-hydroxy-2-oxoglutarate aldolase/2-dehydro-3-deoxy-phosphogluconate aldolase [Glaciihabitans tibetensis]PRY68454.1 2-keto-3-deoxy-phosphogluconate aldolase [Glaciihabitans tibetensis]
MTLATTTATWFANDFFRVPVIAVFRNLSVDESVRQSENAWDAGVENVEIPIQTPEAIPALKAVVAAAARRGLSVGAGTITTLEQLNAATDAGVSFTVSPGLDADIVQESARRGIPHLPGVATASEILLARSFGLHWVKMFPASLLGAGWAKAMKGPYPEMRFIATGGMTLANADDFLAGGASAVGLGSAFVDDAGTASVRELIAAHAAKHTVSA